MALDKDPHYLREKLAMHIARAHETLEAVSLTQLGLNAALETGDNEKARALAELMREPVGEVQAAVQHMDTTLAQLLMLLKPQASTI